MLFRSNDTATTEIYTVSDTLSLHDALPISEVRPLLAPTLSVATINADDECVIAGPADDIAALAERVTTDEISPTLIPIAAAGHSSVLDPILPEFLAAVQQVELSPPQVPYLSNLTGTWITAEQATDPQYWVDHLRHTVRFADCLKTLLADGPLVLMELGPGHSLSSYARRQAIKPTAAIPALRHPNQEMDDTGYSLLAFARGWAAGVDVDVARFAGDERRLVRLPGYPFRKERHWIEPGTGALSTGAVTLQPVAAAPVVTSAETREPSRIPDIADSFWVPAWVDKAPVAPAAAPIGPWLVVGSPTDPFVTAFVHDLTTRGEVVEVTTSPRPALLTAARSVVLVGPTSGFDAAVDRWLTTASAAARALGEVEGGPTLLAAVTRGATDASGSAVAPADAMAIGVIGTAPREYLDLRTVLVDLDPAGGSPSSLPAEAAAVIAELFEASDQVVARRGLRRIVPATEHTRIEPSAGAVTFRRGGNYLVTGGLGGVGFAIATHLAREHEANLVVVASRPVPEGVERSEWLARHGYDDPTSRRIRRLGELEALGTKVTVVAADLADRESVRDAVEQAERLVGRLDGAIHAAGELRDRPIELATHEDHEVVVGAKARGALALTDELRRRGAELLVLISSTSTVLVPDGQAAYVAANSVLDALAGDHGDLHVRTINYGLWGELGIAAAAAHRSRLGIDDGEPVSHPVLSETTIDRDGTVRLVGTLATEHHWLVDEHRTRTGTALLPGTGHVELFLAAIDLAAIAGTAVGSVTLLEPLVVPDGAPVTVRVSVAPPGEDGTRWAQIESDGGVGHWRLHSEAQFVAAPDGPPAAFEVPARPDGAPDLDPLARPASQLELGPRWNSVDAAWRDGDDIVGRLQLAEQYAGELDAWLAHPALVDVATAFGVSLGEHETSLYVPVGYDGVRRTASLPARPWVRAARQSSSTDDLLRVDLTLGDDDGRTVLAIDGLALRPIGDPAALADPTVADVVPASDGHHRVAPLVALAEEHGIRAAEGAELLERVLGSGRDRLVASSIDLADLLVLIGPQPAAVQGAPAAGIAAPPASNSVVATIRGIWVDLLGVTEIGEDDDFFEVGGHSLIAIRLMSRIHKELGVRFQLATIFDAPTIGALAAKVLELRPDLDDELAAAAVAATATVLPSETAASATPVAPPLTAAAVIKPAHQSLVTISPVGDKAPMFIVHGAGGNILFLWSLARALAGSRPIYGFQAHGVDGSDMPDATVEEMAARYVAELRAKHQGPYLLGGYSGGGIVTFEMVRQLEELGEEVTFLVLFDSVPPGRAHVTASAQVRNLLANIGRHGYGPLRPYVRARVKGFVKRFLPQRQWRVEQIENDERDLGIRDVEDLGFVNLFYYFSAAADRYEMHTIDVDAAVLKAEWVWPVQPHDYYWRRFIKGELEVAEVPGDHNAMFYPENAPRLAEVLQEILDRRGL